ncbi:hypothetical protein ACF1BQ_029285 [Bradyrhizobium sp. RDT10]
MSATAHDGTAAEVGGVLILRDGQIHGGDAFAFYMGAMSVPLEGGRVK